MLGFFIHLLSFSLFFFFFFFFFVGVYVRVFIKRLSFRNTICVSNMFDPHQGRNYLQWLRADDKTRHLQANG